MKPHIVSVAFVLCIGGCAYKAETVSAPAYNLTTSFGQKIKGLWGIHVETNDLTTIARSTTVSCSAHTFPLELAVGFRQSVVATLDNVFDKTFLADDQPSANIISSKRGSGVVRVRPESVAARLNVVPSGMMTTAMAEVEIVTAVSADRKDGRVFGKTFEGKGRAEAPSGFACEGAAVALKEAAEKAQRDVLRRIGEDLSNSERLRSIKN